jgi:hypothetical protein
MAKKSKNRQVRMALYVDAAVDFMLYLLIFVISLGLFAAVVKTLIDLRLILSTTVEEALRHTLINVLIILAVVEVLKTVLIYVKEGPRNLHHRHRSHCNAQRDHVELVQTRLVSIDYLTACRNARPHRCKNLRDQILARDS